MMSRAGFDLACCQAAMRAMQTDDPTFTDRARQVEFHGLYDPQPCGAVLFEGNVIHVASLRACGPSVRRLVRLALQRRPILFAPIAVENLRAQRLAQGLGFHIGLTEDGFHLYWKTP